MAESVVKLKAVCMVCFKDAAFTKRIGTETEVRHTINTTEPVTVLRTITADNACCLNSTRVKFMVVD